VRPDNHNGEAERPTEQAVSQSIIIIIIIMILRMSLLQNAFDVWVCCDVILYFTKPFEVPPFSAILSFLPANFSLFGLLHNLFIICNLHQTGAVAILI
jgi:hypothetical protein